MDMSDGDEKFWDLMYGLMREKAILNFVVSFDLTEASM